LRLSLEEPAIFQERIGIAVVRNLDARGPLGETLFQANEAIDSESACAPGLFDAVGVVYEMDLGVGAYEQ